MPQAERLCADDAGLTRAAALLRNGALVAFPTETVYGLGADATDDMAVARIFEAKGRPQFNPLIVHVTGMDAARAIARFDDAADRLARAFWPGPLTLVLPRRADSGIAPLVSAGLDSIALRMPAHPLARDLLGRVGRPVAAPSANPSGRISATTADHVRDGLGERVAAILDGGACPVGLESTIVGLLPDPVLLRPGGLPAEAVEACLGAALGLPDGSAILSSGQMASHYAPRARMRLNAESATGNEVLLGFGNVAGDLNLSPTGDLVEAAANLFGHLHRLDAMRRPIAVAPVPETGLGRAINDRLRRAAAPR